VRGVREVGGGGAGGGEGEERGRCAMLHVPMHVALITEKLRGQTLDDDHLKVSSARRFLPQLSTFFLIVPAFYWCLLKAIMNLICSNISYLTRACQRPSDSYFYCLCM
jgi:fucose 4-O-acetylase-like acetyltransferase